MRSGAGCCSGPLSSRMWSGHQRGAVPRRSGCPLRSAPRRAAHHLHCRLRRRLASGFGPGTGRPPPCRQPWTWPVHSPRPTRPMSAQAPASTGRRHGPDVGAQRDTGGMTQRRRARRLPRPGTQLPRTRRCRRRTRRERRNRPDADSAATRSQTRRARRRADSPSARGTLGAHLGGSPASRLRLRHPDPCRTCAAPRRPGPDSGRGHHGAAGHAPLRVLRHGRLGRQRQRALDPGRTRPAAGPAPGEPDRHRRTDPARRQGRAAQRERRHRHGRGRAAGPDSWAATAKPGEPRNGQHIRKAAEEAAAGEVLVKAGTLLNPAHLALAALAGHDDAAGPGQAGGQAACSPAPRWSTTASRNRGRCATPSAPSWPPWWRCSAASAPARSRSATATPNGWPRSRTGPGAEPTASAGIRRGAGPARRRRHHHRRHRQLRHRPPQARRRRTRRPAADRRRRHAAGPPRCPGRTAGRALRPGAARKPAGGHDGAVHGGRAAAGGPGPRSHCRRSGGALRHHDRTRPRPDPADAFPAPLRHGLARAAHRPGHDARTGRRPTASWWSRRTACSWASRSRRSRCHGVPPSRSPSPPRPKPKTRPRKTAGPDNRRGESGPVDWSALLGLKPRAALERRGWHAGAPLLAMMDSDEQHCMLRSTAMGRVTQRRKVHKYVLDGSPAGPRIPGPAPGGRARRRGTAGDPARAAFPSPSPCGRRATTSTSWQDSSSPRASSGAPSSWSRCGSAPAKTKTASRRSTSWRPSCGPTWCCRTPDGTSTPPVPAASAARTPSRPCASPRTSARPRTR